MDIEKAARCGMGEGLPGGFSIRTLKRSGSS
jgi:hypothetical protein